MATQSDLDKLKIIDDAAAAYESEKLRLGFNHNHGIRESWNEE